MQRKAMKKPPEENKTSYPHSTTNKHYKQLRIEISMGSKEKQECEVSDDDEAETRSPPASTRSLNSHCQIKMFHRNSNRKFGPGMQLHTDSTFNNNK